MSNRTLIEINHDLCDKILNEPSHFATELAYYLSSGSKRHAEDLEQYGVRVIGMKHHSEGHDIKWGLTKETENERD